MANAATPIVVMPKKKGWGCFGCGCAIVLLIAALFAGLLLLAGNKIYHAALGYTGEQAAAIIPTDSGPDVYNGAERKLSDFGRAFELGQSASLHLTSDEINTLIARDPAYARLRGHMAVTLQGETANLQTNFLLGTFESAFLSNRYLNTNATLGLSFDPSTNRLLFDLQNLSLNGQPLPQGSYAGLDQSLNQLVNQQLQTNQLARDFLARVNKAGIENGELVIETK